MNRIAGRGEPAHEAIERALPMVSEIGRAILRKWSPAEMDEVMAVGRLALVEAGTPHDPTLGTLEAFASKRVRGAMIDYARGRAYDVDRTAAGMYAADSNDDGDDDAHEDQLRRTMLGEAGSAVAENLHYLRRQAASLLIAKLYAERDTGTEDDVLERRDREDQLAFVRETLAGLPARQKEVVRLFYEEEIPLGEIGERLGVDRKTAWRDHDAVKAAVAKALEGDVGHESPPHGIRGTAPAPSLPGPGAPRRSSPREVRLTAATKLLSSAACCPRRAGARARVGYRVRHTPCYDGRPWPRSSSG